MDFCYLSLESQISGQTQRSLSFFFFFSFDLGFGFVCVCVCVCVYMFYFCFVWGFLGVFFPLFVFTSTLTHGRTLFSSAPRTRRYPRSRQAPQLILARRLYLNYSHGKYCEDFLQPIIKLVREKKLCVSFFILGLFLFYQCVENTHTHAHAHTHNFGCLNIHGTNVTTNNSTNNNVEFFFVSDFKIVYYNNY